MGTLSMYYSLLMQTQTIRLEVNFSHYLDWGHLNFSPCTQFVNVHILAITQIFHVCIIYSQSIIYTLFYVIAVEEEPLVLVPVKTEVKEEAVTVFKTESTSAQPTGMSSYLSLQ